MRTDCIHLYFNCYPPVCSYLATFYSIVNLRGLFIAHPTLVGITAVALLLNRYGHLLAGEKHGPLLGHAWQIATMGLLWGVRTGRVDLAL